MENSRKIDRSFIDRQGVLHLLEKLKKENITYAEMDEIGSLIRKAGHAAVQPLLRSISREKSGLLVSKYTYLLDFLDDKYWLDQIIQIALKRRDLEFEGKSAILAMLEECGIDVSVPPFSTLLSSASLPVAELFSTFIHKGDEGIVYLLEDFASMAGEVKNPFLQELARLNDDRVATFLGLLLWFDDEAVVKMVITALGRVRSKSASSTLNDFRKYAPQTLQADIDQNLKRLSFLGYTCTADLSADDRQPFHSAYAGPVDGNGYRNVLIARWRVDGGIDSIDLQLHSVNGLEDVWGERAEPVEKFVERSLERAGQEIIEPVAPEFAIELLRDALYRSREQRYPLPPEFMLRRQLFAAEEITPALYTPPLDRWRGKTSPAHIALSTKLFEDEFFAGWAIESCQVYDTAEEWVRLEKISSEKELGKALERLIESLCKDAFQPKLDEIAHCLLLNADFLARTGAEDELIMAAIAAAESIREFTYPCHLHPFMRRFAMESMIVAREAMTEGYDIRNYEDDWE